MGLDERRQQLRDAFIDARGFWNESLGELLALDPDFFAAYAELSGVPWRQGPLDPKVKHLILLAMNQDGYRNLCKLVSAGFAEGFHYKPRVDKELLRELNGGIIALSGCLRGEIAHNLMVGQRDRAFAAAEDLGSIFKDRFYLEIQDNHLDKQEAVNAELIELAKKTGLPLVGTNDCHYLNQNDARAHEILMCVQQKKTIHDDKRLHHRNEAFFVKTPATTVPGSSSA